MVTQLLTDYTNAINNNQFAKESFLLEYVNEYISKYNIKIEDVHNYYLAKLNSKTHSSNYLTQNQKTTEVNFMSANARNEKIAIQLLKEAKKNNLNVNFPIFIDVPIWFHFQVIDLLISIINKADFEKLFYINCLKKINVQISKL